MQIHRNSVEIAIDTPAKLNLSFEVLGRRTDGYHEIESLMCPISIYDSISFVATADPDILFHCHAACGLADAPHGSENLVVKAIHLFRQATGERRGAIVKLVKRIPSAAGLGGGSSDAAAALVAANIAWNRGLISAELMGLAAQLGSDVPFFLTGGAAICRGRGEKIESLHGLGGLNFVVVRPPEGLSTATVYRNCEIPAESEPSAISRMSALIKALQCGDLPEAGKLLFNRLQSAAEKLSGWVERLNELFCGQACFGHSMSGSGTSYFGLVASVAQARRLACRLRSTGIGFVAHVQTCGSR